VSDGTRAFEYATAERSQNVIATYRVTAAAAAVESRAATLAIEQSVEMPLDGIDDPRVHETTVGRVLGIVEASPGAYDVTIGLASDTLPPDPGQMLNMLFGNSSLHGDVTLSDVDFPAAYLAALGGPRIGIEGIRSRVGAGRRALTATALKPQGLPAAALARLAYQAALGGIDVIKDDHGLADQSYSPFADRVRLCAAAVRRANRSTGRTSLYAPSLSGSLDELRRQLSLIRDEGLEIALIAPMLVGLPSFHALAREADGLALIAHPSLAGAQRIAPPLLLGRLFRLLGADATIYPNSGGRFSYGLETCRAIARRATEPWGDLKATAPTPAGGMTLERVPEILDLYGTECMLLIGGNLLAARDRLVEAAAAFAEKVERHGRG
jgi:ribulose-bisphosphate carboxylase large chain